MGKLDHYANVATRLTEALTSIASIETTPPTMISDSMGYIRARVVLLDGCWADGTATFILGLEGRSAQATNPIEDCETSAVGRALAFLGYATNNGVASRNEIIEAVRRANATNAAQQPAEVSPERAALLTALKSALDARPDYQRPTFKAVNAMSDDQIAALTTELTGGN